MRKIGFLRGMAVLFCCVCAMAVVSCGDDDDDKAPSLSISPSRISMVVGDNSSVRIGGGTAPYTLSPTDASIADLQVKKNSISIRGLKAGSAVVVVEDKNKLRGSFLLAVADRDNWLQFNEQDITVEKDKTYGVQVQNGALPFTVVAEDATVAEVSVSGNIVRVRGLKAGTTTLTVTDKHDRSGTINVTVTEKEAE